MTSVRDIIILVIVLFVVGASVFTVVNLGHKINTAILNVTVINQSTQAVNVINHTDTAINMMDYIYLGLFIGFLISVAIFGYLVWGNPILTPIYFILVVIFTFVAVILQYSWTDIANSTTYVATAAALPITNFLLSNLGYFTALMGLIGMVAMFAKPEQQMGGYP